MFSRRNISPYHLLLSDLFHTDTALPGETPTERRTRLQNKAKADLRCVQVALKYAEQAEKANKTRLRELLARDVSHEAVASELLVDVADKSYPVCAEILKRNMEDARNLALHL